MCLAWEMDFKFHLHLGNFCPKDVTSIAPPYHAVIGTARLYKCHRNLVLLSEYYVLHAGSIQLNQIKKNSGNKYSSHTSFFSTLK